MSSQEMEIVSQREGEEEEREKEGEEDVKGEEDEEVKEANAKPPTTRIQFLYQPLDHSKRSKLRWIHPR